MLLPEQGRSALALQQQVLQQEEIQRGDLKHWLDLQQGVLQREDHR